MAESVIAASGRIKPGDADAILIGGLVAIGCSLFDDDQLECALQIVARALPMASKASRVQALVPAASSVIVAAPSRRRPSGASAWCRANMDLRTALTRDALAQAIRRIDS